MSTQIAPGSNRYSAEVQAEILNALAGLPENYAPRTRHIQGGAAQVHGEGTSPHAAAGSQPNYTNRLILQASPYLRQHAHNPVDWRPWGQEALREAQHLKRPVFLSVGYSTCHWCHVMEHESFEDLTIAELLNSRYVPVKVDREERPDVDQIYMAAVQAMHDSGGWPMSVWLMPAAGEGDCLIGLPFYAGTYFPPFAGHRGQRLGFHDVLTQLADLYRDDPARVAEFGQEVTTAVQRSLAAAPTSALPQTALTDAVFHTVTAMYDRRYGGLARAPKFPSQVPISLLARYSARAGNSEALEIAKQTFLAMFRGGVYDQVGGGFHRYSTDARWFAPHFEKMLYDQGLIVAGALDIFALTQDVEIERAIRETLDYLIREMRHSGGGLFSATDADSEGVEGKFFLWTTNELSEVLGAADGDLVARVYACEADGNFEHSNILHRTKPLVQTAAELQVPEFQLYTQLRGLLDRLYQLRLTRPPPLRDDKIVASWNGLAVTALARAGWQLQQPAYVQAAEQIAKFVLSTLIIDGKLRRSWLDDVAGGPGFLDDYAFVIQGLLALYSATHAQHWLNAAIDLQAKQDQLFADARGGYFATAVDAEVLLARAKPTRDGAEPAGNSVAALNLLQLAALTGVDGYRASAEATLCACATHAQQMPMAATDLLVAVEAQHAGYRVLVIVLPSDSALESHPFGPMFRDTFLPHVVWHVVRMGPDLEALSIVAPLVGGKIAQNGKPTAYLCTQGTCALPTTEVGVLASQLAKG